ncbi:MAG: sugar transferase [Woeseiaceae bacterium]|nr:sugar transferase [Woeseiaceae bacterium]
MIRFFDVLFSGIALIFFSPFLIPIIIILKLSGEGEIFFLQERVGKNRESFYLFKFATMLKNSSSIGTGTITIKNDPRVLPIGRFLRRTKINELPQLLNIFLGSMSFIGPRPQTLRCFEAFPADSQEIISRLKPGLSGIGPVVFRKEEDILESHTDTLNLYDNVIAPYKGKVESWYIDKQNMIIYFALIFLTVWVVFFPNSGLIWKIFSDLPIPPDELKKELNFFYRPA